MYNEELRTRAEEYVEQPGITKKELADRLDVNRTIRIHMFLISAFQKNGAEWL